MKQGIILINAYTQSQTELNQPKRLQEELKKLGVKTEIIRNLMFADRFGGADFCVYLDKDKYCARILQQKTRLFNRAEAIEVCDDKMLTQIALQGVAPMPDSLAGALCYTPSAPIGDELLGAVESRLGYPVVVKESFGSLGKGVYKANDRSELTAIAEKVKLKPHLFQKFVATSFGTDVRAIVVGGKVTACMRRVSQGDFRSNAELGGRGEPFALDDDAKALCKKVARTLKLDYCGIDLLFGEEGFLVCEVNSNAFFGTIERVSGINVAKAYAEHIYEVIYHGKND